MNEANAINEGKILPQLLQEEKIRLNNYEAKNTLCYAEEENEQLKSMLENYKNHVIKQHTKSKQPIVPSTSQGSPHPHLQQKRASNQLNIVPHPHQQRIVPHLISHSQPCLFTITDDRSEDPANRSHFQHFSDPREENANEVAHAHESPELEQHSYVKRLKTEIAYLNQHIDRLQERLSGLNQLEAAYKTIEKEFELATSEQERRDRLEQVAEENLVKMQKQIHLLSNENEKLRDQLGKFNDFFSYCNANNVQLDLIVNQLLPKNRELVLIQERQRIELEAQEATLEEQRTHIEVLERALSNTQERLTAKDRQTADAIAMVEKCTHLQKLLQETLDEKQRYQEICKKQKAKFEMELTQLRMHISRENGSLSLRKKITESQNFSPEKGTIENDKNEPGESLSLEKLYSLFSHKDYRISELEATVQNLQKRILTNRTDDSAAESLIQRVRILELEKAEKERRLQELIDEKYKMHYQWLHEQRSLENRIRQMEVDFQLLVGGKSSSLANISRLLCQSQVSAIDSPPYSSRGRSYGVGNFTKHLSTCELPNANAPLLSDNVLSRMEALKHRLSNRRVELWSNKNHDVDSSVYCDIDSPSIHSNQARSMHDNLNNAHANSTDSRTSTTVGECDSNEFGNTTNNGQSNSDGSHSQSQNKLEQSQLLEARKTFPPYSGDLETRAIEQRTGSQKLPDSELEGRSQSIAPCQSEQTEIKRKVFTPGKSTETDLISPTLIHSNLNGISSVSIDDGQSEIRKANPNSSLFVKNGKLRPQHGSLNESSRHATVVKVNQLSSQIRD